MKRQLLRYSKAALAAGSTAAAVAVGSAVQAGGFTPAGLVLAAVSAFLAGAATALGPANREV